MQRRLRADRVGARRARGGRVRASRIHVFDREPRESQALVAALLLHFGFSGATVMRAPDAEWSRQLQESLEDRYAEVYYALRAPDGQEILPRALCFAVGADAVAAVVRRIRPEEELELSSPDQALPAMRGAKLRDVGSGDTSARAGSCDFIGSDEIVLTAANAGEMWRKVCSHAGVNETAVREWGTIDRAIDRNFSVRRLHKYGTASKSANIEGLRRTIGNDRAEIWEIEALGTLWCYRIAAINYRTLAVVQSVRR